MNSEDGTVDANPSAGGESGSGVVVVPGRSDHQSDGKERTKGKYSVGQVASEFLRVVKRCAY